MTEIKEIKELKNKILTGERALFASASLLITDCIFEDGESPLKESCNIELEGSMFKWKYPLWYCRSVRAKNCVWFDTARAGVWYSSDIKISDCPIEAPKNFRRCTDLELTNVAFSDASETLWSCDGVKLSNVTARGDYFAMNSTNMTVDSLTLFGNYSFDGVKNLTVENSKLLTKDAFWNSEHVTAKGCFISGEYLGWNAKDLTLIDCTIESLQGLCYIDNLVMRNCKLINTTLAFEYSTVDAEISSSITSVLNPSGGRITADSIGELIIERDRVDPAKTTIICRN